MARTAVKQHIAIAAAIEAGNGEGAAKAMEEHLDYVLKYSTNCSWTPSWRTRLDSAALLLFGLWIRLRLEETPVFEHEKAKGETTGLPFAGRSASSGGRSCSAAARC